MFKEIVAISKNYAMVRIDGVSQDDLLNMTASEKATAMAKFKEVLQPGDLYVYRHGNDGSGSERRS